MKHIGQYLIAVLVLLLATVLTAWAEGASVTGEVIFSSSEKLIIDPDRGERMTFVVTPETDIPGPLSPGMHVRVEYRTGAGDLQATRATGMLPQTASPLGLLLLIGVGALGSAGILRALARPSE